MSCFPKNKSLQDAVDLKVFNKVCFQAKFAARVSKNTPATSKIPKFKEEKIPRYLQPSRAAMKRNEENLLAREKQMEKRAEETEQEIVREQNAVAKQKQLDAERSFQARLRLNIDKYDKATADLTTDEKNAEDSLKAAGGNIAFSPVKSRAYLKREANKADLDCGQTLANLTVEGKSAANTQQHAQNVPPTERFSPIKNRRDQEASRADKWLDRQILARKKSDYEAIPAPFPEEPQAQYGAVPPIRPERYGNSESYTYADHSVIIPKMAAKRCYRVLTYADTKEGERKVMSVAEGSIYYCRTGDQKRRITPDGVAFDSRQGALSERFPINQVGVATSGNGTLPRILVAFDCWGKSRRRNGGGEAAIYEYCKFVKIEEFLNAPRTVSKRMAERPIVPNYFARQDSDEQLSPRKNIDRGIYLDKRFDTRPWRKTKGEPVSARTKAAMSALNQSKPRIPGTTLDKEERAKAQREARVVLTCD